MRNKIVSYTVFTDLFMMLTLVLALVLAISSQENEVLSPILQTKEPHKQVISKDRSHILLVEVLYGNRNGQFKVTDEGKSKLYSRAEQVVEFIKKSRPEGVRVRVDERANSSWLKIFDETENLGVRVWRQHQ